MIDNEFMERCKSKEFQDKVDEYYGEFREKQRVRVNKWNKENPEKLKASQAICDARRRMSKTQARLILTKEEREKVKEFYINCPKGYHVDHIIPISKGGSHTIENLQYLTKEENLSKGAKWIGIDMGDHYDPDFLLKRLERELDENEDLCMEGFKLKE